MRLLKVERDGTFTLQKPVRDNVSPYAILSHTWSSNDEDEVTFQDLQNGSGTHKQGYRKIEFTAKQAREDGLEHFWCDTCCIDKANHVELGEAINSMFEWYSNAATCYAYLADVSGRKRDCTGNANPDLSSSRWFRRGWTLQELLAPKDVRFFSREWDYLGTKFDRAQSLASITGIPARALQYGAFASFSVKQRLGWATRRETTRIEDRAYCLLGIFGVHLIPNYGEKNHAWERLLSELAPLQRRELDEVRSADTLKSTDTIPSQTSLARPSQADREDLIASLKFDQMDARRATIKVAHRATCKWIISHPKYRAWKSPTELPRHNGFLWIKGKPGAGKSTIIKYAHAAALKAKASDDIIISFFFNARGDELEKSTEGMYRSLLCQLLSLCPDTQCVLDSLQSLQSYQEPLAWKGPLLAEMLSAVISKLGKRRLHCFIDALDECDEDEIRAMIEHVEEISDAALESGSPVHVCFASRHYPTISTRAGLSMVLEEEEGHSSDLEKYVRSTLRCDDNPQLRADLTATILNKANGVFMWAVLVVDILNKEIPNGRIVGVQRRLEAIPPKLSDLFKDILTRDHARMDELLLCIQWVLFARRPLRREEFYYAMLSGLQQLDDSNGEWNSSEVTATNMQAFVTSTSKGLAETTPGTKASVPTVQFIHESVRDYLIKDNGLRELWPDIDGDVCGASHERLMQCCDRYWTTNAWRLGSPHMDLPKANSPEAKELRDTWNQRLPFLQYATSHTLYHANEAAQHRVQTLNVFRENLKIWLYLTNILQRFESRRHTLKGDLLYLLAEHDCGRLIRCTYSRAGPSDSGLILERSDERFHYPLFVALRNGHKEAVRAILQFEDLEREAECLSTLPFGQDLRVRQNYTPVDWATEHGKVLLVEQILEYSIPSLGTPFGDQCDQYNIMTWAACHGSESSVRRLLAVIPVALNTSDHMSRTPIQCAAAGGHIGVVKLLLEAGAELNGEYGRPPLTVAIENGHISTAKMLLSYGASPDSRRSVSVATPFEAALMHGQVDLISSLAARSFELEETSPALSHRTPLAWAASEAGVDMVQALLSAGAKLETECCGPWPGRTALSLAATTDNLDVVRSLLAAGADIETTDADGATPLHHAVLCERRRTAELLLAKGANIGAKDYSGNTALTKASSLGYADMVHLLLWKMYETNARDRQLRLALKSAAEHRQVKIVEIHLQYGANARGITSLTGVFLEAVGFGTADTVRALLAAGWDVDGRDCAGRTALIRVVNGQQSQDVVRLLLDAGADIAATDFSGRTPMSHAISVSAEDVLRILISHLVSSGSVSTVCFDALADVQTYFFPQLSQPGIERDRMLCRLEACLCLLTEAISKTTLDQISARLVHLKRGQAKAARYTCKSLICSSDAV